MNHETKKFKVTIDRGGRNKRTNTTASVIPLIS
jgi:hypothetical protein